MTTPSLEIDTPATISVFHEDQATTHSTPLKSNPALLVELYLDELGLKRGVVRSEISAQFLAALSPVANPEGAPTSNSEAIVQMLSIIHRRLADEPMGPVLRAMPPERRRVMLRQRLALFIGKVQDARTTDGCT